MPQTFKGKLTLTLLKIFHEVEKIYQIHLTRLVLP